ncbi:type-F conjugative transfer system pilin assembly thiol-disulfide isomerase TrbB [Aeromonas sp. HMWF014]|uniref:type-F conjugative transfer system pilin assembly thiol-disulfide isomerase TrbB n=1 Tax=Aeromonas sp. HMWF014 TaxID=2056850 RepID=UPI000D346523|nr:type-F conjugative transfer system pilin assembly thiol-disulfide isomerase TrbB [Aeromonas sp. HMWF014]PTT50683.1 type-F conjugative transfer system pilin assembly thiol-disulfide isomerase TrbB [Aeromonas sp. HMWF014]
MDTLFARDGMSAPPPPLAKRAMLAALLLGSMAAHASTWNEIAALDAAKQVPATVAPQSAPSHTPFILSDGRRVRAEDWKVVLFMQSTCSYCHQFDPLLKAISEQTGLGVFPYTLDGRGDAAFPSALTAGPDVMVEFFSSGLPIATPTTFLVNVHTMTTYPLFQGAVDQAGFMSRLDEVFQIALNQGVPHGQQ